MAIGFFGPKLMQPGSPSANYQAGQPSTASETYWGIRFGGMSFAFGATSSYGWAKCNGVTHGNTGAFDTMDVSFKGIPGGKTQPQYSTSGGTNEEPIATHPNYTAGPRKWGTVFGDGPESPNSFGRVTDEDGAFKHFGHLPDGINGRPAASQDPNAKNLMGVEAYLSMGQCSHSKEYYSTSRQCSKFSKIGRLDGADGACSLPGGRNWLLNDVQQEEEAIGNGAAIWHVTMTWLSSGEGGYNGLIYH
jgi:hypothetical protein